MLGYTLVFIYWLYQTKQLEKIRFQKMEFEKSETIWLFPLILFPIVNLLIFGGGLLSVSKIILMLSVSCVEEIFFRGFLQYELSRKSQLTGILITNIIFAGFHLVNFVYIPNATYIIIQVLCAFFIGSYYSLITIKFKSLFPCILSHFLINITSGENNMNLYIDPGTGSMLFTVLIGIIGAVMYSIRMLWIKFRFKISGGKIETTSEKIPMVIFSDDKRYWTVFEPICREFDRRGIDVVYMTASEDDPALSNCYEHIKAEFVGSDNKAFAKLNFLNAVIVLSTTPGLDVYQWKRSKETQYYVHIPHAASEITLYRMFGIDYYDAVLLSGEYQMQDIRKLEKLRGLSEKELVKVGIPYMDEMAVRYQKSGEIKNSERTILLAPSWGKSAIFSVYGGAIIETLLKTGNHIIVRPHPQSFKSEKELMEELMKKYPESDQLEWNQDTDNFEVLRRSDILISDFSGVIFEFTLIYDKPVIYTDPQFDISPYDAWWLKQPLWTISALPRLGKQLTIENMGNLNELINSCLMESKYVEGRKQVKEETWAYVGEGAARTVDYLMNKYEELTHAEEE